MPDSFGAQFQTYVASAMVAEGLAVRVALTHVIHLGITKVWLRSDSLGFIRPIVSVIKPKNLHRILLDIETLSSFFNLCVFFYP